MSPSQLLITFLPSGPAELMFLSGKTNTKPQDLGHVSNRPLFQSFTWCFFPRAWKTGKFVKVWQTCSGVCINCSTVLKFGHISQIYSYNITPSIKVSCLLHSKHQRHSIIYLIFTPFLRRYTYEVKILQLTEQITAHTVDQIAKSCLVL